MNRIVFAGMLLAATVLVAGCSRSKSEPKDKTPAKSNPAPGDPQAGKSDSIPIRRRKPAFGAGPKTKTPGNSGDAKFSPTAVVEKLKPLQVIVGSWKGLTRKKTDGLETPKWAWDLSNRSQPALAFESAKGPYFRKGKLTWLPKDGKFQLTATDKNGKQKTYTGTLTEPVADSSDDGKTVQRSFTLTLTQIAPAPKPRERNYQIAIQQLRNDRYLTILRNKARDRVTEWDRIANQRQGTSFAGKLDDYGERTCVVSQGLGTMTVSYKGRTYYVCCSGCRAAFNDEPEKWIAAFEEWKKKNGKK